MLVHIVLAAGAIAGWWFTGGVRCITYVFAHAFLIGSVCLFVTAWWKGALEGDLRGRAPRNISALKRRLSSTATHTSLLIILKIFFVLKFASRNNIPWNFGAFVSTTNVGQR